MTVPDVSPTMTPTRIGQGTAVEQSRAVAEVQAAVIVAQQCPRSITLARSAMQASCAVWGMAERAFYRFPRAGQTISGPSVHLARELARCWGNVQYGVTELRRDDEHAQSEMQAWAWDVQTNTRSATTFIVPHLRDKKTGPERLTDMRDIYENNANQGARRLREVIFSILPPWFTEEAQEACRKTLDNGEGKPLEVRVAGAVKMFDAMGITLERLERKIGRPADRWDVYDVTQLVTVYRSLSRGEIAVADEFPDVVIQRRVTEAELAPPAAPPADPAPTVDEPTAEQRAAEAARLAQLEAAAAAGKAPKK
jgi:hypothetical protein